VVSADNAAPGSQTATSPVTGVIAPAPPVNTGAPAVSGTATAGRTLTADDGAWAGTPAIATTRQWQRCDALGSGCLDVPGETGTTYVLADGDVGATFRIVVTAANAAGSAAAASAVTAIVQPAPPVNASAPWVTGTALTQETLTAHQGTWTGTGPIGFAFRWQRCDADGTNCADIDFETNQTYTTTIEDVGRTLRVVVTATNAGGSTEQASLETPVIAGLAPQNTTAPSISGTPRDGETLTADDGTWTGSAPLSFDRQWRRCDADGTTCADIPGAAGPTYEATPDDVGHALRVVVTASNTEGPVSATSDATAPVAARPPANTTAPAISGLARDTLTLDVAVGDWSGTPAITYVRQWQRCDGAGANCADIPGADGASLVLGPDDVGRTLRVTVTATNAGGQGTATSAPSDVVAPSSPLVLRQPQVVGEARQGATLTADKGDWAGTPAIGFAYRWKRCDPDGTNCQDVVGATDPVLTLGPGDVGFSFRVVVTAFNAAGSAAMVSAQSDEVLPPKPVAAGVPEITGVPGEGVPLTATTGTFTGTGPITYAYRWQRCEADGSACTDIPGATTASYTPGPEDVGRALVVVVTATNRGGSTSQASRPSVPVAPIPTDPGVTSSGGPDLSRIPGSKVATRMCQVIENGVGFRRANIPGVGPVRLRLRAEAIVVPESPLRATLSAPAERTRRVSFRLDGRRLQVTGRGEWKVSVTPQALATAGRHRLAIITTPTVGRPSRMTEVVTTVPCTMRYTAGMWRTNVGTGMRLRVDSRRSLRRLAFRLPSALVSGRALQAQTGLGRLRIVQEGGRSTMMTLGGASGASGVLLSGTGRPRVIVRDGLLRVSGLPAGTGIVEVTLYQPGRRIGRAKAIRLRASATADGAGARSLTTLLRRATGN
ncbi:MAG: hypothetical protein MUC84_05405, partial [Solirubrobacteraceae bacterium]|nr:hypothetical protein [Solirubrobacteraceae bacterium]